MMVMVMVMVIMMKMPLAMMTVMFDVCMGVGLVLVHILM